LDLEENLLLRSGTYQLIDDNMSWNVLLKSYVIQSLLHLSFFQMHFW